MGRVGFDLLIPIPRGGGETKLEDGTSSTNGGTSALPVICFIMGERVERALPPFIKQGAEGTWGRRMRKVLTL